MCALNSGFAFEDELNALPFAMLLPSDSQPIQGAFSGVPGVNPMIAVMGIARRIAEPVKMKFRSELFFLCRFLQ